MGKQVDLSMTKFVEFGEKAEWLLKNLANTANTMKEIVHPVATSSGSELLNAINDDSQKVIEDFTAKATTISRSTEGIKEYVAQLEKMNRV